MTDPRLPRAVALTSGVGLQTIDFVTNAATATLDATGSATVTFDEVPGGQYWRVERIVVTCSSASTSVVCSVYGGSPSPINLRDWTPLPVGKPVPGEYSPPITIESSTALTITFTGGNAGDTVSVHIQYAVVQRSGQ